eukprot:m.582260 g.582260  ORF g.582260 m.582260 type:complete len:55 (-) comp22336_c0_seq17:3571-3735(-)
MGVFPVNLTFLGIALNVFRIFYAIQMFAPWTEVICLYHVKDNDDGNAENDEKRN